jgi:hypothetical protein
MARGYVKLAVALFLFVVALAGSIADAWRRWRTRRLRALRALAARLGLRFRRFDCSIPERYPFLDALSRSSDGRASNVLAGNYAGHPVRIFEFRFRRRSESRLRVRDKTDLVSLLILEHEEALPGLIMHPMRLDAWPAGEPGPGPMHLEPGEFSEVFCVRSQDREFAHGVCHPRMKEYLLQHRDLSIEIEGPCLAISFNRRLDVEEIPERLKQLVEIRKLLPEYLFAARPDEGP